jgi:hypothetical protein
MLYNLIEIQFCTKSRKLKMDKSGEDKNKELITFLEIKGYIHNLSLS